MTFILGARCQDGIALVADTKFTVEAGSGNEFDWKIAGELHGVLTGFSGAREPFEEFRIRLREYRLQLEKKEETVTADRVKMMIREIMKSLDSQYGKEYAFDLIVGISESPLSTLHYFYQDGRIEPIKEYKAIGSGGLYSSILLKQLWNDDMKMSDAADLGFFLIKYLERSKVDLTISLDSEPPLDRPQIVFIPDGKLDWSPEKNFLDFSEIKANARATKLEQNILKSYDLS